MESYLQRHPYDNIVQERAMPRPGTVVPILLPHFSLLSTTILTFLEAVDPYLQRHPYANEVQERVMPRPGIVVPILLAPLRQHQIWIPLLALHIPPCFPVVLPPF